MAHIGSQFILLTEELFNIEQINPDNFKFDKVSRIVLKATTSELDMILDVNTDVYPLKTNEVLTVMIASSLTDTQSKGEFSSSSEPSLLDKYEYCMHGRIFSYEIIKGENKANKVSIIASFGGLLMCIKGPQSQLRLLEDDTKIYLLIRKAGGETRD